MSEQLLVGVNDLVKQLGICRASVYMYIDNGTLPKPIRLGGRLLWRHAEILDWIDAGCPTHSEWEEMKAAV